MTTCQGQQEREAMGCGPRCNPTPAAFTAWLRGRLERETLAAAGCALGVDASCISRWINGKRRIPLTVLLLAGYLMREPREMAAGLPDGPSRRRAG